MTKGSSYAFLTTGTLLARQGQPGQRQQLNKVDDMEPKIYLLLLLVGMIIGSSYLKEAGAFIRKRQLAWPRHSAKRNAPHKT
jgi:hypothetical protein